MIKLLTRFPSRKTNRLFLIAGLIVFIPAYGYNYILISKILTMNTLVKLLTCFKHDVFKEIILTINREGNINAFFKVYVLNIISIIGFMFYAFALTLSIARRIRQNSQMHKIGFIFPVLIWVVGLLDILSSLLLLYTAKNPNRISVWMVYTIDACYVSRLILLYAIIVWFILASVFLIMSRKQPR